MKYVENMFTSMLIEDAENSVFIYFLIGNI